MLPLLVSALEDITNNRNLAQDGNRGPVVLGEVVEQTSNGERLRARDEQLARRDARHVAAISLVMAIFLISEGHRQDQRAAGGYDNPLQKTALALAPHLRVRAKAPAHGLTA